MTASLQNSYPKTYVDTSGDTLTILRTSQMKFFSVQYEFAKQYKKELSQAILAISQADIIILKGDEAISRLTETNSFLLEAIESHKGAASIDKDRINILIKENKKLKFQNRILKIGGTILAGLVIYTVLIK